MKKLLLAVIAITTLGAAFTSCKKDSNIQKTESIKTITTTGEFKEDNSTPFFDKDGNEFKQVHIHRYAWMTSNLNYKTENSEATPAGMHYTYQDAMNGVCPEGWSIPSTDAWEDLKEELGHHCNGGDEYGISKALRCDAWNNGSNASALNIKPFYHSNYAGFWLSDGAVFIYENGYQVKDVNSVKEYAKLAVRCVRNN